MSARHCDNTQECLKKTLMCAGAFEIHFSVGMICSHKHWRGACNLRSSTYFYMTRAFQLQQLLHYWQQTLFADGYTLPLMQQLFEAFGHQRQAPPPKIFPPSDIAFPASRHLQSCQNFAALFPTRMFDFSFNIRYTIYKDGLHGIQHLSLRDVRLECQYFATHRCW